MVRTGLTDLQMKADNLSVCDDRLEKFSRQKPRSKTFPETELSTKILPPERKWTSVFFSGRPRLPGHILSSCRANMAIGSSGSSETKQRS